MYTPIRRSCVVLVAFCLLAACAPGTAPEPGTGPAPATATAAATQSETGAFVTTLGRDTISVERFTRSGNRIEGRQVLRIPRTTIRDYTAVLGPDGTISHFEMSVRPGPEAQPTMRATIHFERDSAVVNITQGDSTRTLRMAAAQGAIPSLGAGYALYELPLRQMQAGGRDSVQIQLVPIGGAQAATVTLRRSGADGVIVRNVAGENRARVDAQGRLLGFDGRGSTFQVVAERLPTLDVDAIAAAYAARDQQGQALGSLSPRDTVRATVGGANLMVDYSRPMRRGRQIFGNVVAWNQVWRTGANQATQFRTDRDLVIAGTTVPAGMYTLWTIPTASGWTLIINRQTGQWGTDYDQSQDLVRIPVQPETLSQPVEQFTIGIEPQGQGGALQLMWDDTRVSVPFTVR